MPSPQPLKWLCLPHPSKHRPALWWPCAATTALAKSAPSWHLPVAVANLGIAVKVVAMDGLQTGVTAAVDPMTVLGTVPSVRTAARVWVMRLSVPSAMRWNTLK
jgi:hypothetical protein